MKIYLAEKKQLDEQNQTLAEINAKLAENDLTNIVEGVLDFVNDPITIEQGALDSITRRITT